MMSHTIDTETLLKRLEDRGDERVDLLTFLFAQLWEGPIGRGDAKTGELIEQGNDFAFWRSSGHVAIPSAFSPTLRIHQTLQPFGHAFLYPQGHAMILAQGIREQNMRALAIEMILTTLQDEVEHLSWRLGGNKNAKDCQEFLEAYATLSKKVLDLLSTYL